MDKSLKKYEEFIKSEISKLAHDKTNINQRAKDLLSYHDHCVRNFQHERLIHLIVTIFFAVLLILTSVILFIPNNLGIEIYLMIIDAILFIVELFYIRHYYRLENGTEKLYEYSKKIFELTK